MSRDVEYPLPCCYPDGSCEDFIGDDLGLLRQQCEDSGGCWGLWTYACEDWDCENVGVSCCDLTDGTCHCGYMWSNCITDIPGGYPLCPGCEHDEQCDQAQEIKCEQLATEEHVCCLDDDPYCQEMTYLECVLAGGIFLWEQDVCNERVCEVGCREAQWAAGHPNEEDPDFGPYVPTWGPEWGQKEYTTDTCYPVAMAMVKAPTEGVTDIPRGRGYPITAREVRNVAQVNTEPPNPPIDPCALAHGIYARGEKGRLRPYLCSQLDQQATKSAAYSEGFFCKSVPDEDGECPVVPRGRCYARVAVMAQPPREVQYHHPQLICGGIV